MAETYGTVKNKNDDKGFHDKYKHFSKHQLIKELHNLKKGRNSDVHIKTPVRNATFRKNNNIIYTTDHDKEIKENFWAYTKSFLEKDD